MIILKTPKKTETKDLEAEIERLLEALQGMDPDKPDYSATADQIVKFKKLLIESDSKKRVSPDTLVQVAGSLLGILLVMSYEHAHVISAKALAFVKKS